MSGKLGIAAALAAIAVVQDGFNVCNPDHDYLSRRGWIPLGQRAFTGEFGWTTLERGCQGAVSTAEALEIQRRVDNREMSS